MHRARVAIVVFTAAALVAAASDAVSARRKLDLLQSDQLKPGSRVDLTLREINAYVDEEAPAGVRNTRLEVTAPGAVTGTALVDFAKLREGQGRENGWLFSRLLDGERPVSVTARIQSSGGHAQVDVQRVEISGIVVDGATLDFLIRHVLEPLYPDAVVNRPFELGGRIERLDVQPAGVGVVIGR